MTNKEKSQLAEYKTALFLKQLEGSLNIITERSKVKATIKALCILHDFQEVLYYSEVLDYLEYLELYHSNNLN